MPKIDLERASLLLGIVVEAGKHGPLYQVLVSEAQKELREMVLTIRPEKVPQPTAVTPAAGPANGLNANGSPRVSAEPDKDSDRAEAERQRAHSLLNESNAGRRV